MNMWANRQTWIQKSYMIKPSQYYKLSGEWSVPSVYCVQYQWFHCMSICLAYCFLSLSLTTEAMTSRIVDCGESLLVAGSPFNDIPPWRKKGLFKSLRFTLSKTILCLNNIHKKLKADGSTAWSVHLLCTLSLVALSVDSAAKMMSPPDRSTAWSVHLQYCVHYHWLLCLWILSLRCRHPPLSRNPFITLITSK
jgi:hypothetical protein